MLGIKTDRRVITGVYAEKLTEIINRSASVPAEVIVKEDQTEEAEKKSYEVVWE